MLARLLGLLAITLSPAFAQLAAPNSAGVAMGHVHLSVKDLEVNKHFWIDMLGGVSVQNGALSMVQFPGTLIMFRQADPAATLAPSIGSIVDHIGFTWKDLPGAIEKWRANHLKIEQATNPNQGYLYSPEGVRVEFFSDPSLRVPVQTSHIHFYLKDVPAMQAWYAKIFGGVPCQRARILSPGMIDCDDLPGVNLSFSPGDTKLESTKGRALDHIGFEVKDLDAFVKKLEAQGIKLDAPVRASQNAKNLKVAFLTDPWGTYIELTEGLAP